MKKLNIVYALITLLTIFFTITSCSKDDDSNTKQPSTTSQTYTGVLIGSTGAYELNLKEDGANASVVFNDDTYNLSTSETLQNGESLTLTDGTISLTIEIDVNGKNPEISFTIPGHDIQATIILSNQTNPNRNYIGWTENFRDGVKVYRTTFNLTLHEGNKWTGIERIDVDIDPENPDHQSTQGQVTRVGGTYTENENGISFFFSNGSSIFTLNKTGNKLTLFQSGATTFEVELTKVN